MAGTHKIGEPITLRRMRQNPHVQDLAREKWLSHRQFIQPLFVVEGIKKPESIPGITGTFRETPASMLKQIEKDLKAGVSKFLLFGVPAHKSGQHFDYRFTASQIAAVKKAFGQDVWLAVDVCLCSSTEHGQCGILNKAGDHVENEKTTAELAAQALSFAQAGADCVAPSDMMDGRIHLIRETLDAAGYERTVLMSYAAKFHSGFYGPFRHAADSAPKGKVKLTDRATYQIDVPNYNDALRSALRDANEGADILMVKPGLPYLDVLSRLSAEIPLPWAVYQVSGEAASIELMAKAGLVDERRAMLECWNSFARAGANMIISYHARRAKEWIGN